MKPSNSNRRCLRSPVRVSRHISTSRRLLTKNNKITKCRAGLSREGGVSNIYLPFVLVVPWSRSDAASGKVGFYLGKEAVPRHRLQALLSRGEFDRALDLARAHSMDETEVHAARLLALLREGGEAVAGEVLTMYATPTANVITFLSSF